MTSLEERIARLEDAIIQLATLQDPNMLAFPRPGNDPRVRAMNAAEQRLAEIADELRQER